MHLSVPRTAYKKVKTSNDPLIRIIGCLVPVTFYLFLQVGEYTKPRFWIVNRKRVPATRTKQFVAGNIVLLKDGVVIPRTSPLDVLITADLAVMNI